MSTENKTPREWITTKRTKKSNWEYIERSDAAESSVQAISPDKGYFEKIILREVSPETDGLWVNHKDWDELWDEVLSQHWNNLEKLMLRIARSEK